MTDAEKAYAAAERLIEQAKDEGWESLSFVEEEFQALEDLPDSLSDLTKLTSLDLDGTQVADITPLQALTNLTHLDLRRTQVVDVTPLQALTNLTHMYLSRTQVVEITPLQVLTNLTGLDLSGTQVADVTPLRTLTKLTHLYLRDTQVSDVTPLQGLINLAILNLSGTQVADFTPLQGLINLAILNLSGKQVADVTPLQTLSNLTELFLSGTQVTDVTPLQTLTKLTHLYLSGTQVVDVTPLQTLTNLTHLYLSGTQVVDVTPLQTLTNLTNLELDGTQVVDLRTLSGLSNLIEAPSLWGLQFSRTRATELDPKIAEIAEINDSATRAKTLFDYLRDWQPPGDEAGSKAPKPDPLFPVDQSGDGLEVAASCPTEEEQEDALKRAMHRSLPDLLERLAREAGNQFPRLAETARRLTTLLDAPFEDLDMTLIHLGFNELRAAEKAGQEDGMTFTTTLQAVLSSACDAGGALTVDHPMVTLLMDRARKARDNPDPQEDRETQNAMSRQVAEAQDAMGDRLRALEARVANSDDPQDQEAQKAVNRNVLWRIGTTVGGFCLLSVSGKVVGDVLGQPLVDFVNTNLPVLYQAAQTYGMAFAEWFLSTLSKVKDFAISIAKLPPPSP